METSNDRGPFPQYESECFPSAEPVVPAARLTVAPSNCRRCLAAMSSYLYIVKYELPIVIMALSGSSNG